MTKRNRRNRRNSKKKAPERERESAAHKPGPKEKPVEIPAQEKKSILRRLHQDYGLTAALTSLAAAAIGGTILLYINGKLPFISQAKTPEAAGVILDQSHRSTVQNNNYVITNKTENKNVSVQKNQTFQDNNRQDKKDELYEVYLRDDTGRSVSYQTYDYGQRVWELSTIQPNEELSILSIEPRVLFRLEDHTGNVYIFNTRKISEAGADLKADKIVYNIKEISSRTIPSRSAENFDETFVWKIFTDNREVLPDPSLNLLNNTGVTFTP